MERYAITACSIDFRILSGWSSKKRGTYGQVAYHSLLPLSTHHKASSSIPFGSLVLMNSTKYIMSWYMASYRSTIHMFLICHFEPSKVISISLSLFIIIIYNVFLSQLPSYFFPHAPGDTAWLSFRWPGHHVNWLGKSSTHTPLHTATILAPCNELHANMFFSL